MRARRIRLTTGDRSLFERTFSIHDHGFKRFGPGAVDGDGVFGLNLRMHELTAALALAQTRKLVREVGPIRWEHLTEPADIARALPELVAMHLEQWKDWDDVVGSFDPAHNVRFFEALGSMLGERGWLVVSRMRAGDQLAAFDFLRGEYRYKFRYATGERRNVRLRSRKQAPALTRADCGAEPSVRLPGG